MEIGSGKNPHLPKNIRNKKMKISFGKNPHLPKNIKKIQKMKRLHTCQKI